MNASFPRLLRPRAALAAALAALAALALAALVEGCRPREIVPRKPSLVLVPDRELVEHRRLVLDNGLKVLLVSNPNADKSAAALAVGVGSLADPAERPGLAHFLEHMLFLGTEKYPEPNAYSRFMSSHAGGSNAYTADDHTNYFFSIAHDAFPEGLERFAQFFIAPLFNPDFTQREMKAVESEHAKNLDNDQWRIRQAQRLHYKAGHPLRHFSTGNLETLRGVSRETLLRFYRNHYSADRMTLAVVSNRGLDALEGLVRGRFDRVERREVAPREYPVRYLERERALRILRVRPVTERRLLMVQFALPPAAPHYEAKPLHLIASVLGHEGEGSLLSTLKADNLATSLRAGSREETRHWGSLEISVGLTEEGLERSDEVLERVLGAIVGLRREGIPRHVFEERQTMRRLEHRFREVPDSGSLASRLSAMMQSIPMADLPDEALLLKRYDPALYRRFLDRLTPDNMLVTLVAQGLPVERSEPYYGTRYSYEVLRGEPYRRVAGARPDPRWHVPAPNRFIPEDVVLREPEGPLKLARTSLRYLAEDGLPEAVLGRLEPLQGEVFSDSAALFRRLEAVLSPAQQRRWLPLVLKDALHLPRRLLDVPQAKVWYLPDWRFRQPKAEIVLKFFVADAYASPRHAMLGRLYAAALEEELNEFGYPIKEAGLRYGIDNVKGGLVLRLSGYSARMVELLQFLVERLRRIGISEATFATLKEHEARGLDNARLEQPYRQARYYRDMLLERPNYTRAVLREALEPLTLEDVRAFAGRQLRRTYVEGVVVGNLAPDAARRAVRRALDTLDAGVLPEGERVEDAIRDLPPGANWVFSERVPVGNSATSLLYQVGPTEPALRGALQIIARPLGESIYHRLRTRQQLGYIVWGGMAEQRRTLYLSLLVQSSQYPADVLRERMEAFIPQFIEQFRGMPGEAFEQYRRAVIQGKLQRAEDLGGVANSLYWLAFRRDEEWDYQSRRIAAVESLTREQVERVLVRHLRGDAVRRLAIRLTGRGHEAGPPEGQVVRLPPAVQAKAG